MSGRFRGILKALNYAPRTPCILFLSFIFIYNVWQPITLTSWYVSLHTGTSYYTVCFCFSHRSTVCFCFSHQSTVCFEVILLLWVAQPFVHKAQFIFKTPSSVSLPVQGKIVEVY